MLGIAHRVAKAKRSGKTRRRTVKAVPRNPKTPGDFIRLGRYKKGVKIKDLATKLRVTEERLHDWEVDIQVPNSVQWAAIAALIPVPSPLPS